MSDSIQQQLDALQQRVQKTEDELAIRNLIVRYCLAVDCGDDVAAGGLGKLKLAEIEALDPTEFYIRYHRFVGTVNVDPAAGTGGGGGGAVTYFTLMLLLIGILCAHLRRARRSEIRICPKRPEYLG